MPASGSDSSVVLKLSKISSYLTSFQVDVPTFKSSSRPTCLGNASESSSESSLRSQQDEHHNSGAEQAATSVEDRSAAQPPSLALSRNSISTYYGCKHELFTDESFKSLGTRIKTYGVYRWMLPPDVLSVYVCARRGWYMVSPDMLCCSDCDQLLSLTLPRPAAPESYDRALQLLKERVHSKHLNTCRWRTSPSQLSWCRPPPLLEPAAMYALVQLAHDMAVSSMCNEQPYMAEDGRQLMDQLGMHDTTLDAVLGLGHSRAHRTALLLLLCGWKSTSLPATLRCELCKRRIGLWCFRSIEEQEKLWRSNADAAGIVADDGDAVVVTDDGDADAVIVTNNGDTDAVIVTDDGDAPAVVVTDDGDAVIVTDNGDAPAVVVTDNGDADVVATDDSASKSANIESTKDTNTSADNVPSVADSDGAIVATGSQSNKCSSSVTDNNDSVSPANSADVNPASGVPSTFAQLQPPTIEESSRVQSVTEHSPENTKAAQADNSGENTKIEVDDTSNIVLDQSVGDSSHGEEMIRNDLRESSGGAALPAQSDCSNAVPQSVEMESTAHETGVTSTAGCQAKDNLSKRKRQDLEDDGNDDLESGHDSGGKSVSKKSKLTVEKSSALPDSLSRNSIKTPRPVLCPVSEHHAWCGWVTPARHHALPQDALGAEGHDAEGYRVLSSQLQHTVQRATTKRWTEQEKY
ncbi:Nuclear-interacting partner of ALK/Rsm1-like, partial [Trinorchestia longiramus]